MSCPSDDTLLSWRSGKLPGDEGQTVEQHVDQCADCQAVLHAAAGSFDSASTAVTPTTSSLAPGELVGGRYRIVRFVGSGGMGAVYEAVDQELGDHVALKTLHERFATDPLAILRLKREALLARRITHPNVCRIFDVGYDAPASHESTQPPRIFLMMELLRGETLRQRIRRRRLNMSEARPLVEQLAAALGAAHAGRVIHRDFKSDNVILVETQAGTRAVVTDFGLARAILGDETRLSRSGALIGTPAYMAPEQILAGAIDKSVDIYALGVVMFEMLTGELPFGSSPSPSPIKERLIGRPPSPRALVPELSASWERVVTKCLEPEPGDRFAQVDQLVAALDAAPPRRRSRVSRLAITTGALFALGLGALVSVSRWRTNESAPWSRANQLFRVTPSIAPGGATITLEGLFGSAADARFPGVAPVRVTAIGPNQATVQVPASARSGELTVAGWTGPIGASPFRRTSFPLGVGVFERYYEQTERARSTPALPGPREYHSSIVIGDSLYIIGGYDGRFRAGVDRATINADGSLSSFSIVPNTTLQTARDGHTSIVIGNSVYVIGGNAHGAIDSIERATINADGSLSPFSTVRNLTLNTPRAFHTCEVIGDSLYVIGGIGVGENRLATIERATIHGDGSLSAFSTIPVQLGTPRSNHTSVVFGRWLYVIGGARAEGDDDVDALASVERASLLPDGSLSSFSVVSRLAVPRGYHSSTLLGDVIYVMGGWQGRQWLPSVERATLHEDGSLGPFAVVPRTSLTVSRASHSSVVIGNSIYVIGGSTNNGSGHPTYLADLERATIDARGDLAPFSAVSGTGLAVARSEQATVVAGDSLYLIGGFAGGDLGSVEHARIDADGSLSAWGMAPGVALIKSRHAASSVVVDEWLYIIGGIVDGGRADATIERARLRAGSLSPFSIAHNVSLATARSGHANVVIGGSVYVIGGADQLGHALALTERARVGTEGWVSSFTPVPELALTTARYGHTLAIVGDWLYVIGGVDAEEHTLATVERARIGADGHLSPFAPVPGLVLTTARHGHGSAVVGDWLYIIGGENRGALGSLERAAIGPGGELARFSPVSTTLMGARHGFGAVVLGNSLNVIGGRGERPLATLERADLL